MQMVRSGPALMLYAGLALMVTASLSTQPLAVSVIVALYGVVAVGVAVVVGALKLVSVPLAGVQARV